MAEADLEPWWVGSQGMGERRESGGRG